MDWIVTSMRDVNRANYFEAHITIEPIGNPDIIDMVRELAKPLGFRLAELLMKKREDDTEERSKNDTFLTSRSYSYLDLYYRTNTFVSRLTHQGIRVWRFKLERTIVDTMYNPSLLPDTRFLPEKYLNPRDPVSRKL